jgi:hypothetical protein
MRMHAEPVHNVDVLKLRERVGENVSTHVGCWRVLCETRTRVPNLTGIALCS